MKQKENAATTLNCEMLDKVRDEVRVWSQTNRSKK